ncbi:HIT domain-containing protein [uncultured Pseudokineococcus sp.]|uniref:HIT domain-containing protein n=1 Tax=uncultured Pseudokineococcus sp. TaxID=1642928 RepID=UPI002611F222|nr:HIT domain-containing protein [uncultured Pseudokineococcus sp.]
MTRTEQTEPPGGPHETGAAAAEQRAPVRRQEDCVFCRIVAGDVPAELVASTDSVVAFRDLAPKAPLHVLVVPREHHADVVSLAAAAPQVLADLVATGARVAADGGAQDGEHRLVFNTGESAGQSVFHAHGHVLAAPGGSVGGDL